MNFQSFKSGLLALVAISFIACNDDFLDATNPNEISGDDFFRNGIQAQQAVNAIYANAQRQGMYSRHGFLVADILTQDFVGSSSLSAPLRQLQNYTFDGSGVFINRVWDAHYGGISKCNYVLDGLYSIQDDLPADISPSGFDDLTGQAHFFRAWHYSWLVSYWGGVPIETEPAGIEDFFDRPRVSIDSVFRVIYNDLDLAYEKLPEPGDEADPGRVHKATALAHWAKMHLYQGNYEQSRVLFQEFFDKYYENTANAVEAIPGGLHSRFNLVNDYFQNFNKNGELNQESLFEIQYTRIFTNDNLFRQDGTGIGEVNLRGMEYGFSAWANVRISPSLHNSFEDTVVTSGGFDYRYSFDPRFYRSFYLPCDRFNNLNNTITVPATSFREGYYGNDCITSDNAEIQDTLVYTAKYQVYDTELREENRSGGINFRVIRLADVMLMYAEALNELGIQSEALFWINKVRKRARECTNLSYPIHLDGIASVNLPDYGTLQMDQRGFPAVSRDDIFEIIKHERRIELWGEQVLHFDQRRWLGTYGATPKSGIELPDDFVLGVHELLPIPTPELDRNNLINQADQNPGY